MIRAHILVIDDDPLFRSLITSMLRKDYVVFVASEGSEGYYKAIEHPPQLIIVDVQMPGWDGLRTVQAIRAHHALSKIPVMMLTSDASRQTVVAAIQCGANDYVIKTTLSRDELLKKTRRLVSLGATRMQVASDELHEIGADGSPAAGPSEAVPAVEGDMSQVPADDEAANLQALIDNWE
jgi:DNA-binding response OmpR family regulator